METCRGKSGALQTEEKAGQLPLEPFSFSLETAPPGKTRSAKHLGQREHAGTSSLSEPWIADARWVYGEEWRVQLDAGGTTCITGRDNERAAEAPGSRLEQKGGASRKADRGLKKSAGWLACLLL
ncbi:hypothetical protein OPT61_g7673 [Boeremia exigua]|uniref:Uncharacterized protein n=1 Tax=Boeremia exigua TaxID=749465 RepID=A0ACC2I1L3_9PLEO|nr:hypothetical protein OPT61_g7673 [Boeremia exigua]